MTKSAGPADLVTFTFNLTLRKNFMAPFYRWVSTALRLEPLRGGSVLFTTKFSEIPGTHFIDLGMMKGESSSEPPSGFEHGTRGLGIQRLNHYKA